MVATVTENWDGRTDSIGESNSAEIAFTVFDAADEDEARTAVLASAPAVYPDTFMTLTTINLAGRINETTWSFEVSYGVSVIPTPGLTGRTEAFDTTGGVQHITQSISTPATVGNTPSLDGAIGFDGEKIQGADIVVPTYNFEETWHLDIATVTIAYRKIIQGLTGKVNNLAFKGWAAGEVLFLGASATFDQNNVDSEWSITFRFAVSLNNPAFDIGLGAVNKDGWEYAWVKYKNSTDSNSIVRVPDGVYIEQVYESGNFAGLNIGT